MVKRTLSFVLVSEFHDSIVYHSPWEDLCIMSYISILIDSVIMLMLHAFIKPSTSGLVAK